MVADLFLSEHQAAAQQLHSPVNVHTSLTHSNISDMTDDTELA